MIKKTNIDLTYTKRIYVNKVELMISFDNFII